MGRCTCLHVYAIDRTYPSHPYFSTQVKHGRTALYNVLRAYAVADPTVGYCQGLSFVAGLILLHVGTCTYTCIHLHVN